MSNEIKTLTVDKRFKVGDIAVLTKGDHGFKKYIGEILTINALAESIGSIESKEQLYSALAGDGKKLIFIPDSFMEFKTWLRH